jgi:hypothetical protein
LTTALRRQQIARAQETLRRRERDAGLVRITVTIPEDRRAELQQIAAEWREEANPKSQENL